VSGMAAKKRRRNAGRTLQTLGWRPSPESLAIIDAYADHHNCTRGCAIDDLIRIADRNMLVEMLADEGVSKQILLRTFMAPKYPAPKSGEV
jgi:hypothetical protein